MSGTQLDQLYEFVTAHLPARLQETTGFESWMDNIELLRSGKALGMGQLRIGVRRYNGVMGWDRWPYRQCNPDLLFALVCAWLDDHGNALREQLKAGDPEVYVEIRDNQSAIVMITVPLADEITLRPDDEGQIPYSGRRYQLDAPVYHEAVSASVESRKEPDNHAV